MTKQILTINPGSTAVKYTLFNQGADIVEQKEFDRKLHSIVQERELLWLSELSDIGMVSVRIVHGNGVVGPRVFDVETKRSIKDALQFAPIHNAIALDVIGSVQKIWPDMEIIVSFDTDFHVTMPKHASTYPIKQSIAEQLNIKKYGFHGLAVQSVLEQLKQKVKDRNLEVGGSVPVIARVLPSKVICAHLGGGCSITAVLSGKSIDTTMGLTPLEGLMMITRSGSVGPGVVEYIANAKGWTATKVLDILNNESGFYGMTGSKNTLDIIERASKHQEPEKLAFDIFVHKIVKQIFAYYGTLQGCDALIFSGGMGYGNAYLRSQILSKLKIIGITEENTHVFKADEARVLFENITKI